MTTQKWTLDESIAELGRLISPDVLGFYSHFEVIEVFAQIKKTDSIFNVFTILIAEDHLESSEQAPKILNSDRIKLTSLPEWNFGVQQYTCAVGKLIPALQLMSDTGEWRQSGKSLKVGDLQPQPPQFAYPDAIEATPWNRILKNNFWNGCHFFEWADHKKAVLQPLIDDPRRIQELSEAIRQFIPLGLASLSDRLGNLIVQLPVTVLKSHFGQPQASNDILVEIAWHPKASKRDLRVNCEVTEVDGAIPSYSSCPINGDKTLLKMQTNRGSHRAVLWDERHQVILAAIGPSAFLHTIAMNMMALDPEPRIFITQEVDCPKTYRVGLSNRQVQSVIGEPIYDQATNWTQKRIYTDEVAKLSKERRFVQYRPDDDGQEITRKKAIDDLRYLINHFGQEGAWLWDPYLSAHDVLDTLFYCGHSGAQLRALSGPRLKDLNAQAELLKNLQGNLRGLNCEYRNSHGMVGWDFHDRFLIFPKTDRGALAWSLGTSVNSAGTSHHILQQVSDGQLISDAFTDLWEKLDGPEYLIWKKP